MNCMEFRRQCLTNPYSQDSVFMRHQHTCRACATYAAQQQGLERDLQRAMKVDVPVRLKAQIRRRRDKQQNRRWRIPAIAAAALTAVTLTLWVALYSDGPTGPDQSVVRLHQALTEHMLHDPLHAVSDAGALLYHQHGRSSDLQQVVEGLGGRLVAHPNALLHAVTCRVLGQNTGHLVLQGDHGPVTVFLLPTHEVAQSQDFSGHTLHTRLVSAGPGSMAIIGNHRESLVNYERSLRRTIDWHQAGQITTAGR